MDTPLFQHMRVWCPINSPASLVTFPRFAVELYPGFIATVSALNFFLDFHWFKMELYCRWRIKLLVDWSRISQRALAAPAGARPPNDWRLTSNLHFSLDRCAWLTAVNFDVKVWSQTSTRTCWRVCLARDVTCLWQLSNFSRKIRTVGERFFWIWASLDVFLFVFTSRLGLIEVILMEKCTRRICKCLTTDFEGNLTHEIGSSSIRISLEILEVNFSSFWEKFMLGSNWY